MKNPYLWPQIWDGNKHVKDAHWIYPGDPVILPKVAVVAEQAGQAPTAAGEAGEETAGGPEGAGAGGATQRSGASSETAMTPVTEEMTLRCAEYVATGSENDDLRVMGSEQGSAKTTFAAGDIVYVNKGAKAGLKAGDLYSIHRPGYQVVHPITGKNLGRKVETSGWLRVILVQDEVATALIEQVCAEVRVDDYLKPLQPVSVPVVARHPAPDRLTPPSGKLTRHLVDIQGDMTIAAAGQLVTIDAGSEDGITPGSIFTVFRVVYPDAPSPRNVVGELVVVAVREKTAVAKLMESHGEVLPGDQIELR
jgi:hypothetical protein